VRGIESVGVEGSYEEAIKPPVCLTTDLPKRPSVIPRKQRHAALPCQSVGRFGRWQPAIATTPPKFNSPPKWVMTLAPPLLPPPLRLQPPGLSPLCCRRA